MPTNTNATNAKPQGAGQTHTRETWHVNAIDKHGRITGDETSEGWDKLHIGGPNCTVARVYRAADARRIVACVNACAGVSDATLAQHGPLYAQACATERDALREHVAELERVLVQAVESTGHRISGPTDSRAAEHGEPAWVCNARAALRGQS